MKSGIGRAFWGLLATLTLGILIEGCGETTSSNGSARLQPVLPADASAAESSLTYEAAQGMFEVHRDQMNSERIVRNGAWSFIEDALLHEDFEVQRIGADLLREVIIVEPEQKAKVETMLRQQLTLSLPEDKMYWQGMIDELFPSAAPTDGEGGNTPSDEARDPQAPAPASLQQSAPPAGPRTDRDDPSRPGR
jgi:hypothetical protein